MVISQEQSTLVMHTYYLVDCPPFSHNNRVLECRVFSEVTERGFLQVKLFCAN